MIILKNEFYEEILKHSLAAVPIEACGLLGGKIENGIKTVETVYFMSNMDNSREHFSMDPKEQFNAIKDMRNKGWVLIGNFHSHPASPARPSEEDKRLAFDPSISYLIISLMEKGNPVLKSFKIKSSEVLEEEIKEFREEL